MKPVVLVTGGSGFIGSWVIRALLQRPLPMVAYDLAPGGALWEQILGSTTAGLKFVPGDILDSDALGRVFDEYSISHVIHLAGWLTPPCHENPDRGCEINVLGTIRLLEQIRARRERVEGFSYASSIAVYGPELDDAAPPPLTASLEPQTFYGVFKRATEMIAQQYWRHYQVPSVGLRPFVVYGPGREHGMSAAPTLAAKAVANGKPFTFTFSGAAGFEFVEDTARAFVRGALDVCRGCRVVDLPGHHATVEQLIQLLNKIKPGAASTLSVTGPPLPCSVSSSAFTIERLFPDWQPTPLSVGFRRTVEFYQTGRQG